jgi:hypothetical protein
MTRRDYDFDVFISYASKDRGWVRETLLHRLTQAGLRVCIDFEFEIGQDKTINMENAVTRSRYTLIVLTPEWLDSVYTKYEFRMALTNSLHENERTILPVLLKSCEPPPSVRALTYADMVEPERQDSEIKRLIGRIKGLASSHEFVEVIPCQEARQPSFGSLLDVLSVAEVRAALTNFREDFLVASHNILKLADMKAIHDLLHQLESCHDLIVQETRHLIHDDDALAELVILSKQVRAIALMIREISKRESITTEQLDWVDDLFAAQDLLSESIPARDTTRIGAATRAIDRILGIQPSFIDRGLSDCTANLRLRELRDAIECVCTKARELEMSPEKIMLLTTAATALEEFHRAVNDLVKTHTFWQVADVEMRELEASFSSGIDDLLHAWPRLRARLTRVLESGDDWAMDIAASRDTIDAALDSGDGPMTRVTFRVLRRQAVLRFMHVDTQLNERCKELRVLGEKLAFVSEVGS